MSNAQALTLFDAEPATPSFQAESMLMSSEAATDAGEHPLGGNPVWVIVGLFGAILFMQYLRGQHPALEGKAIAFNFINVVSLGIFVILILVLTKTLFSRFPVPGLTQVIHAA